MKYSAEISSFGFLSFSEFCSLTLNDLLILSFSLLLLFVALYLSVLISLDFDLLFMLSLSFLI